jgi:MOSC domain-containing protein YiiM
MRRRHTKDVTRVTPALVSVNVGLPREVEWRGRTVRTAIFKSPVRGPVRVRRLNLDGDGQADAAVHGGPHKAVYLYPSEHYAWWQEPLGELAWGAFGENLTTAGIDEESVRIGDRLRLGTVELVVTQPRLPCFKLALRFGRTDIERRFLASGRTGFYLSVAVEGEITAGDAVTVAAYPGDTVTVAEVVRLYGADRPDAGTVRHLADLPALPDGLRQHFRRLGDRVG